MLEYQAHQRYLVFQNEHANLVTALPYIDAKLDESDQTIVTDLIKQEMRAMQLSGHTKDYLHSLPLPKFDKLESESIQSELKRVAEEGRRLDVIDQSRYQVVDEPEGHGDVKQWQESIDRANINFQYAENRRMNLELEKEYGKQVWTAHIQQAEDAMRYTTMQNNTLSSEIEGINKKRRFAQMQEYDNFFKVHQRMVGTVAKNVELEKECLKIQRDIQKYQEELQKLEKQEEELLDEGNEKRLKIVQDDGDKVIIKC
ncbi:hypothetical protein FGO68_gene7720 [Halteria grandinella]|uniref:Uncharacterized protein n=1 Tax=Halteria grandinella TaxID=5974 RepID=A0A8J8SZL7_HALGN|nr:hypothetical protein FGO68_gene7720 [Halteria grandinella]